MYANGITSTLRVMVNASSSNRFKCEFNINDSGIYDKTIKIKIASKYARFVMIESTSSNSVYIRLMHV